MNYQYIVNPQTNRKVSIHTRLGKQIIKNYTGVQNGGGLNKIYTGLVNLIHKDINMLPAFEVSSSMGNLFIPIMSLEYNLNKKVINIQYKLGNDIYKGTIKQSMLLRKLEFKSAEGDKLAIKRFRYQDKSGEFFYVKANRIQYF